MFVIPAIDLLGGKCVRLTQGDFGRSTVYDGDPVQLARQYESQGASWVHVVDLDAARTGDHANLETIRRIVGSTGLQVQLGGGVRSLESARGILDMGVRRVVMGSALARRPEAASPVFAELGDAVAAGLDVRGERVATEGWTEFVAATLPELVRSLSAAGARRFVVTDVERDGMLGGASIDLYRGVAECTEARIIASGGIGTLDDVADLKRGAPSVEAVIVGKALLEARFSLGDAIRVAAN